MPGSSINICQKKIHKWIALLVLVLLNGGMAETDEDRKNGNAKLENPSQTSRHRQNPCTAHASHAWQYMRRWSSLQILSHHSMWTCTSMPVTWIPHFHGLWRGKKALAVRPSASITLRWHLSRTVRAANSAGQKSDLPGTGLQSCLSQLQRWNKKPDSGRLSFPEPCYHCTSQGSIPPSATATDAPWWERTQQIQVFTETSTGFPEVNKMIWPTLMTAA